MLNSTSERVLAIAAGGTFAIGGLITILGFEVFTPRAWTPMTVTTILLVAGTIFAGHLLSNAFADKRWLHGLGFSLVFAVGTCAVVLNSVGRQAETTQTKTLSAEQVNQAIFDKRTALNDANDRLAEANDMVDLQTNGGINRRTGEKVQPGCGESCRGWKLRVADLTVVVKTLERELRELGPQKPVNPKAETIAALFELFHFDKARVASIMGILEPFFPTFVFEFGAIVSLGYAFRRSHLIVASPPDDGRKIAKEPDRPPVRLELVHSQEHPVVKTLRRAGGEVRSNRELARIHQVSDGWASKMVDEAEDLGLVEREKIGKEVRIRLKQHAC